MNLFIYEHLTSGALAGQPLSTGLCHEGDVMLQAMAADLIALGHQLTVLRDARLPALEPSIAKHSQTLWCEHLAEFEHQWQAAQAEYTHFIIIAPETDDILRQRVSEVLQAGNHALNSQLDSIALCSDKYRCWQHLSEAGITTPATWLAADWLTQQPSASHWVIKPIDGAGSEMTSLFDTAQSQQYLRSLTPSQREQMIVQPYLPGQSLSLSLFVADTQTHLLSINQQVMQQQAHRLSLSHCIVHAETELTSDQVQTCMEQVVAAISGLWGFIGLDLIVDNGRLWLIEINPRLTSSYAEQAMRKAANPARYLHQHLLQLNN